MQCAEDGSASPRLVSLENTRHSSHSTNLNYATKNTKANMLITDVSIDFNLYILEAQLSHRDRAVLRVIAYFAKSLKVIRNDTTE